MSTPYILAVMLAPGAIAWTLSGSLDRGRWTNASCLLLASSVAYSSFVLSGDIWNVVIYTSTAALVVLYLEDRVKGELTTPAMVALALAMALTIGLKEPQISKLLMAMVTIWTLSFGLTLPSRTVPGSHTFLGLMVPGIMIAFLDGSYLSVIAASLLIGSGVILFLIRDRPRRWRLLRYPMAMIAVTVLLFLPGFVPSWMVALAAVISMVNAYLSSVVTSSGSRIWPIAMSTVTCVLVYVGSGDWTVAFLAAAIVLAVSLTMVRFSTLERLWSRSVDGRVTMLLPLLTIGYLAFYVYYAWTEVYMTEFLVVSCIGFGILVHISTLEPSRTFRRVQAIIEGSTIGPKVRTERVPRVPGWWKTSFVVLLAITVPISVQSFLEDDWFDEVPMDKRPYMDTIMEVSDWIRENTEEGDKVLAWHCYALQAGRETVIEVSNAQVYDGKEVVSDMEIYGVNVFVLCWYTNHGLWEGQPLFQEYIENNFHVVRSIDGNLCFLRNGY